MISVVFIAPFFMETTLRFVDAVASLPGVRLGLISQDPEDKLPEELRSKLAGHYRVDDALSGPGLRRAVELMGRHLGSRDRLLGTLEQIQVPLGELREELGIPGMGAETAMNFRDKARMKRVLSAAGVPCARHRLVESADEAREFATEIGFPVVVKPPSGAGAQSTFRADDPAGLDRCLAASRSAGSGGILIEEFMTGEENSFDSVSQGGEIVWCSINEYRPGPLDVLRHPWIQWSVLSPRELDQPKFEAIREIAGPALKALGLTSGLTHMEWFRRPDGGVAISEVGARPPGAQFTSLLSYAHDFDLYHAWARLMVLDEFDAPPRRYAVGAAYLRGQGRGRVQNIRGLAQAQEEVGDLVVEARLPQPGQSPSGSYEGEGYVILRHPDTAVVERALRKLVERIRVELG